MSNNFNEEIFKDKRISGFNITKVYSDLLSNINFYRALPAEGALFSINKILIEYLYALEEVDFRNPNYDIYISSSIKIRKTDLLPLFTKLNFKKKNTDTRNFQFIYLTMKLIQELFFQLIENISSISDSYSYKTFIEMERKYIENSFRLIKDLIQVNLKNTMETDSFQSSYENLISCMNDSPGKSLVLKKVNLTIEKIKVRNNELYSLLIKLVEKNNTKGSTI